jgi:hypothetical protein
LHGRQPMSVRFAPLAPEFCGPCKHSGRCAGPVIRKSQFESGTGLHSLRVVRPGKAQRGLSTRPIIESRLLRPQLPGLISLRASEPVSCWPHKPCEWRSTRQPATISRGSRSMRGPLACNQQMRVRFPPLPPSSPGRPLRALLNQRRAGLKSGQARSTRAPGTNCDRGRVA